MVKIVDGFNLYYRSLKGTPYKWLNLLDLAKGLLDPADEVVLVRYFTARVSARAGDPDAPRRQQIYLSALHTVLKIVVHYGRFLAKTKRRSLVSDPTKFVEVHDTEGKGSDVNLAAYLLHDGWQNRYDVALVLSQDTDLAEPLRMVSRDLKKKLGLVWLDGGRPNKYLAQAASFVRHVRRADLAAAQFASPLTKPDGSQIIKPAGW